METKNEVMTQEEKKLNIKIFIVRLIGYLIFGFIIPFAFLIWRFELFQHTNKMNIGGWGIVAIIFMAIFFAKIIKQSEDCVDSIFAKQALQAMGKVLVPLLAITLCLYAVEDFGKELINFFMILTICEPIAYVLNPFAEYISEKEKENEEQKDTNKMLKFITFFWDKKK